MVFAVDKTKVQENPKSWTFFTSSNNGELVVVPISQLTKTEIIPVQVSFYNGSRGTIKMQKFYVTEYIWSKIGEEVEKAAQDNPTRIKTY